MTGSPGMRSVSHSTFGDPAKVLALTDSPIPQPGLGQVRLRTILSPIHNHDLWTVRGSYGYKPTLPAIGGSEAVGIVDALGEDVHGVSIGERVAVASVHGTWAQYFLASAKAVIPVPDAIPDVAAAQLIAMPFSAIALLEFLNVKGGDRIIQNAANGAVGKTVAMLAATRDIEVVNLVRRDDAIEQLNELGISNVVSTEHDDWEERARAITGGVPFNAAVDSIGGEISGKLLSLLGEDGLLVSFGSATGEPMQISSGDLIFKQAVVKGFWGAKVSASMSPKDKSRLIGELLQLVAAGKLKLPVEGVFSLDQIADAVTTSLTPGKTGKVLLKP
ncbi:zinc-binding dehydrogenase [Agrobacterium leguminum]|jgi:NADPH:quinone reductase|uniref:zinc-binding dehydrogenase n=1 Tax=Agrobacterium TaxID=357 RepID=UPI0030B80559